MVEQKEQNNVIQGGVYRHFKGKYYEVIGVASYHDWGKKYANATRPIKDMVIYKALYNDALKKIYYGDIFYRELDDFTSEVDKIKYPNVKQKYRFELVENDFEKN